MPSSQENFSWVRSFQPRLVPRLDALADSNGQSVSQGSALRRKQQAAPQKELSSNLRETGTLPMRRAYAL